MKNFIVILREPDGRLDPHSEAEIKLHRQKTGEWFQKYIKSGNVVGGSALTLKGKQIKGREANVIDTIHYVGTEIVGGFILLKAADLNDAINIMKSCPVYEFDGYAEIREFMQIDIDTSSAQ